ncbi:hypothetical protein NliqN6_5689 [Naganishia liquefaciens]|uniref:Uncharacterized protein n=1 Tax=Naganishia liquefaciens TaxID=104408 RepID=A0A8H3TY68_9TREE|nr:hypothetical protein NliqN6_5689 [Naganishia liquefaciens]
MSSNSYVFDDPPESSSHPHRQPKLKMKLKETDAERAERAWRKEQKRLRKESKRVYRANGISPLDGLATTPPRDTGRDASITPPRKRAAPCSDDADRSRTYGYKTEGGIAEWDEDVWEPHQNGFDRRREAAQKAHEEEEWRAKMFDLMEDQEGPNPFVSGRYRSPPPPRAPTPPSPARQALPKRFQPGDDVPDFSTMDDEEYAEAIRYGMWRRQNREEVERLERLKKAQEEEERRKAKLKDAQEREEKRRIEILKRERGAQDAKRIQHELSEYKAKWESLRASGNKDTADTATRLRLVDMPWPIFHGSSFHVFAPGMLSIDKIRGFYTAMLTPTSGTDTEEDRAALKKVLREAILAYHPDRFVGRYLDKVQDEEKEMVKEAVIRTSQIINELAAENR